MNEYAALLKLPFICLKAWLFYASLTPPNPPAKDEDREAHSGLEHVFAWMIRWPPMSAKLVFAAGDIAEVICILAAAFPCILSTSVLSLLTNSPDTPLSTFAPSLAWVVGVMLATAGGGLRVWAFRALGRHFTFELAIFSDHTLITSGPYALVRHPSYTGLLLLVWGMSMALGAPGSYTREVLWTAVLRDEAEDADWAPFAKLGAATGFLVQLVVIVALIARTRKEDHMLRREFGKQWSEWAVRTPWRLFPGVY